MNLKQFKLTNDDEIVCEVVEGPDKDTGDVIIRKVLKIFSADDYENNVRYYSFRPWMSFQDDVNELSALNVDHVIGESSPSKTLAVHYAGAIKEVIKSQKGKKQFDLDEILVKTAGLDQEEIPEYLDEMFEKHAKDLVAEQDSEHTNVIHLRPPTDTKH